MIRLADPAADAVLGLPEDSLLGVFNRAGVLAAADVHVARRLGRLGGDEGELVALATALAVRGPRVGHVHVDLTEVRATSAADVEEDFDIDALPWPEPSPWLEALASSPLVSVGGEGPDDRPLRLVGTAVYLDRYWRDEGAVAADLAARAVAAAPAVDPGVLEAGLDRLFPDAGEQRRAAALAVTRGLSVIAGGPGTGKTTTVAAILALLEEQAEASGHRPPLIGLAAPTGKAAARMQEAVRGALGPGRLKVSEAVGRRLAGVTASTLHRLLGRSPASSSRFRHHRHNQLPHDVVVVDETSMVSLSLMARLLEAVRPDARLVLVGDPEQLASVEAGAVLADIVGPAVGGVQDSGGAGPGVGRRGIGDGIVLLRTNHRFGGALARLAEAIRTGAEDDVVSILTAADPSVGWLAVDASADGVDDGSPALEPLRRSAVAAGADLVRAAVAGRGEDALAALSAFRLLCAHRRGPAGVSTWTAAVEGWLADELDDFAPEGTWYVGRPVIVTANDYGLRLFNGDTGAVVARPDGRIGVVFNRADQVVSVGPARLADVDTVFAMTVHKAQGSELDEVAILLPGPDSRVLTRELLYTAVTRARRRVLVVGSEESVRAAVSRPVARASGLTARLWGE